MTEHGPAHVPATTPVDLVGLPAPDLREWLETMVLIRRFEESAERLGARGRIPAGIHSAAGQEAVAVGTMRALRPDDGVAGTHRTHHHAIAKGLDLDGVMAELYGRATGIQGGRAGSMHLASPAHAYLGGNGIVGSGVGIAMGSALASQLKRDGTIAVGFVGDGGLNVGRTWESANLAAIWRLPLVIICENNMYAVETRYDLVVGGGSATRRAEGFGLPAVSIDGQDVGAVYRAVGEAAARARAGDGPTFIEARTYRYEGHNTGQIITYRTPEEVAAWREGDPIARFERALLSAGAIDAETVSVIDTAARARVEHAVAFAEESPWPELDTALADVTSLPATAWTAT
jgi:pyruvate dehydrogenase E1 component alpha subunit